MGTRGGTAVVTGAGGGLGTAIAERLARDGYDVAALDIDGSAAQATADRVERKGGRTPPGPWVGLGEGAIAKSPPSSGTEPGPTCPPAWPPREQWWP